MSVEADEKVEGVRGGREVCGQDGEEERGDGKKWEVRLGDDSKGIERTE